MILLPWALGEMMSDPMRKEEGMITYFGTLVIFSLYFLSSFLLLLTH